MSFASDGAEENMLSVMLYIMEKSTCEIDPLKPVLI